MEARWRGKGGEGTVLLDISLVASNAQLQTPTIGSWSRRAMEIGSSVRSAFPNLPVYLTPTIPGKKKRITKRIGRYAIVPISSLYNKHSAFPSSSIPKLSNRDSKPPQRFSTLFILLDSPREKNGNSPIFSNRFFFSLTRHS